jgi:hypothetical protein
MRMRVYYLDGYEARRCRYPLIHIENLLHPFQLFYCDDDYGAIGGMRIGRGYRNTRRKPIPVPLFSPQIPHDLNWARTQTAAVGNRRLRLRYGTASGIRIIAGPYRGSPFQLSRNVAATTTPIFLAVLPMRNPELRCVLERPLHELTRKYHCDMLKTMYDSRTPINNYIARHFPSGNQAKVQRLGRHILTLRPCNNYIASR